MKKRWWRWEGGGGGVQKYVVVVRRLHGKVRLLVGGTNADGWIGGGLNGRTDEQDDEKT